MKYIVVIAGFVLLTLFLSWVGFEWESALIGLLFGYMFGALME